jgi:RNA polymerase sigma-70 factor, ECF subfamily
MSVVLRPDPLPEIEQLYRAGRVRFVRVARAIVGDEQTARDVVQEAFTRAVEKRGSFRRRGPLEAWLWRIVVNEARKRGAAGAHSA